MSRSQQAARRAREIAADAGVRLAAYAVRLGAEPHEVAVEVGGEVGVEADRPVAIASLYKLPLALAWSDRVAAGERDPRARVRLAADARLPGPTGVAALGDDVEVSERDAVRSMLAVSDNAAAEAVLRRVGLAEANAWLVGAGCPSTVIRRGSEESWRLVAGEAGGRARPADAARLLADPDRDVDTAEYHPALASVSTPRDLGVLLREAWTRPHHAWVRRSLELQAWRHRLGSGFPHDDVVVAGKTGSLGRLRHEAGVVVYEAEHPVAVAVLTTAVRPELHQPRVDAAIGAIARTLVAPLRLPVR